MFHFAGVDFGRFFVDIKDVREEVFENYVGVFDFNCVILAFFREKDMFVVVFLN